MSLAYAVLDLLGAGSTLLSLLLFVVIGFLSARLLLGPAPGRDPLTLAIATLVCGIAERTATGLALGVSGSLRFDIALVVEVGLVALLLRVAGGRGALTGLAADLRAIGEAAARRLGEYALLVIVVGQALFVEVTRGLLRPPLSWDAIGYHLLLAGRWLQEGSIFVPFGPAPTNFFGYNSANGSIWLWWWLAPSHSELFANLAFLPQLGLLGLATGGVARALGARSWPVAGLAVLVTPCVVRFAVTPYVDIAVAAGLVAGLFFIARWLDSQAVGDAVLAGLALGVSAGTKNLGLIFVAGLLLAVAPSVIARRRIAHALLVGAIIAGLGSYFFLRNLALGAGPVASACYGFVVPEATRPLFERTDILIGFLGDAIREGWLLDALLGIVQPEAMELGVGPQLGVLVIGFLALPFLAGRGQLTLVWLLWSQVGIQIAAWAVFPVASGWNLFSSLRFLDGAIAIGFAAVVASADARRIEHRWIVAGGSMVAVQSILQLHAEMSRGVRLALLVVNVVFVVLVASPWLRQRMRRQAPSLTAVAVALLLVATIPLARFRAADRGRAYSREYTAHDTAAPLFAPAWAWLDANADDAPVAVMIEPGNWLVYPAMGMRLEREVVYVNVNEADHRRSILYESCNPRVDHDELAWLRNIESSGAGWLHVGRSLHLEFPIEDRWAMAHPAVFRLRFEDQANRVYAIESSGGDRD